MSLFGRKKKEAARRLSDLRAELLEARVREARARTRYVYGPVAASYDAAQTTGENVRHWVAADALSAAQANSASVRTILRMRTRYEVANNTYAKGIVLTLANHVVGRGPRLQLLTDDPNLNTEVETRWAEWAAEIGLAAKLRTMRMARAVDGEAFALEFSNGGLRGRVKLDLRLVEADLVTTPTLTDLTGTNAVDGILFDEHGNPKEYQVLKKHPGEYALAGADDYEKVAAEHMYHWFRCDRAGQHRGVPEFTSALPLFAQLRRYTLAVIAAAETAADFAGVLYTDAPPGGEADAVEPMDAIEIERNMLVTMPGGWQIKQMQAAQPSSTYADFKAEILNEIARCVNMPYNIAACNSAKYNYASGRLDHQTYFTSVGVDQADLAETVLEPVLRSWLKEAKTAHGWAALPEPVGHEWMWAGPEHVDPLKEAKAQAEGLRNRTRTLKGEWAKQGKDWEKELRQCAKERDLTEELGLPEPKGPAAGVGAAGDMGEGLLEEVHDAVCG